MSMVGWMTIAVTGGLVSLAYSDFAAACNQMWGSSHIVTRHARVLAHAMTAIWLAAVAGGVHALSGH